MIIVETFDSENHFKVKDKYPSFESLLNMFQGLADVSCAEIFWEWDGEHGSYYVEVTGDVTAIGLIELSRNYKRTTVDELLQQI